MKKNTIIRQIITKIGRNLLWLKSRNSIDRAKSGLSEKDFDRIEEWIAQKRWAEDCSMDQVAEALDICHEQLSAYFILRFGQHFLRWRKEVRIEEAAKLLLSDRDIPTAIIGEAVGISDKSNFRKQFKQVKGCTPSEWRLKH